MERSNDNNNTSKENKPITYIIPHTHWDREWYVPFQYYRFRLVEMVDEVLQVLENDSNFNYFNMDGQTIILEDYLEIKPENKQKLKEKIQDKKIGIGPWYVQASPWLQTGEGIIRNILYGHRICEDFGVSPVDVGWVPDQFIHPPQFPQIYKQFGITHAAFSRGFGNQYKENPKLTSDFRWEGIDGSQILAFHLKAGYGLCSHLNKDPTLALNQVALDIGKICDFDWASHLQLAFSGSDHLRPQKPLSEVVEIWKNEEDLIEELGMVKISSWESFLKDYHKLDPKLETLKGELYGRKFSISLHDVFSSYMPLKQQSFRIHDLFERWAEPFSALSSLFGLDYKKGYIKTGWKWNLKNQPHDSSWTSSVDQVEKEMEVRYDWAEQIGTDIFRRSAQWILQHIKQGKNEDVSSIVVFNPHPWSRTGIITARFENKFGAFQLLNPEGKEITCQYNPVEKDERERDRRRVYVGSHGPIGKNFYEVKFLAEEVPPMGYKTYTICERSPKNELQLPDQGLLDGNDYYLENEVVRVVVEEDGTFTIMHKVPQPLKDSEKVEAMGEEIPAGSIWAKDKFNKYKGLHLFQDVSDVGDGWESISIEDDEPINTTGKLIKSELITASDFQGILKIEKEIEIPKKAIDYSKRSEEKISMPITIYITLQKGDDPVIRFRTIIKNKAKDHKLSLLFPTKLKTEKVNVNGHFGVFDRKIKKPTGIDWVKPPQSKFPHHKWFSIWDERKEQGLAIFTKGLPEYEVFHAKDNDECNILLTLYRSTGRWGCHVNVKNPEVYTPRAQLLNKKMEFEYALVPQQKDWNFKQKDGEEKEYQTQEKGIYRLAEEYYTPLKWEEDYDTYRYRVENSEKNLPNQQGLFEISPSNIIMSSFKGKERWEDEDEEYIIRVYNILHQESKAKICFKHPVDEICFVNLNEKKLAEQPNFDFNKESQTITFKMSPAEIKTVKLRFIGD